MENVEKTRRFPCTVCPMGCELTVDTVTLEVSGNGCPRGKAYGVVTCHP